MGSQSKLPYLKVAIFVCLMACGTMGLPNAYGVFYTPMADGLGVGRGAITLHTVFVIGFVAFVLSAGASAVQNSGMVSVSSLATTLGIPYSGLGVLFGVDQILDLTRTASNAIGDVAVCIIIAKLENELDVETYQAL